MGTFGVGGGGGGGGSFAPVTTTGTWQHPVQGTPPTQTSQTVYPPANNTTMITLEQQMADYDAAHPSPYGTQWIYGGDLAYLNQGGGGGGTPTVPLPTGGSFGGGGGGGGGGSRTTMPQGGAAGSDRPRYGAQPIPGHQGSTGVSGGGSRAYNPNNNSGVTVEPGHQGFKGGTFMTGGGGYSQYGRGDPVQGGSFGMPQPAQGQSIYGQGQPQEERFKPFATLGGMIKGLFT